MESAPVDSMPAIELLQSCMQQWLHGKCSLLSTTTGSVCADNAQESQTKTIDLSEDDPENVDRMLRYIYTHDYIGDPDLRDRPSGLSQTTKTAIMSSAIDS